MRVVYTLPTAANRKSSQPPEPDHEPSCPSSSNVGRKRVIISKYTELMAKHPSTKHLSTVSFKKTLSDEDILCQKSNKAKQHPGNIKLVNRCNEFADQYATAQTRSEKSNLISKIRKEIQQNGGQFVKESQTVEKGTEYFEVKHETYTRYLLSQCFRNILSSSYKSSNENRKLEREEKKRAAEILLLLGQGHW